MLSLQYQKDIRATYAPLNAEEEAELVLKAKQGDNEARNKIVNSQLRQIINVAKAYANQYTSVDDLVGYGVMGIDHALTLFEPSQGNRFYTFAVNWIRAKMQTYALNNYTIRLPMNVNKGATQALKKKEEERTEEESRYVDEMTYFSQSMSMDTPIDEGETTTFGDMLSSYVETDADLIEHDLLTNCFSCLNDNEKKLIQMFYGIGYAELTQNEIGEIMGMTKQGVSLRIKKALAKMQKAKT